MVNVLFKVRSPTFTPDAHKLLRTKAEISSITALLSAIEILRTARPGG